LNYQSFHSEQIVPGYHTSNIPSPHRSYGAMYGILGIAQNIAHNQVVEIFSEYQPPSSISLHPIVNMKT
jgi:hypothetical protein